MEIYKYTPKKMPRNAIILSGICILAASALLLISSFVEQYRIVYQFSCVIFATFAIQFTTRFILSGYVFVLDGINFIVVRTNGKKATQVCNINLQTAIGISGEKKFADIEKEFGKTAVRLNFCQNFRCDTIYTYVFDFNGKKSAATFDADAGFIAEMKRRIKIAKNGDDYYSE